MSPFELSRRLSLAVAGVLSFAGPTGCASQSAPSPSKPTPAASLSQPAPVVAARAEDADSIRLQSDTVDAYTRDLQAAVAKRAATRPAAPVPSTPTPTASASTSAPLTSSTTLAQPFSFDLPADPIAPRLDLLALIPSTTISATPQPAPKPAWSALLQRGHDGAPLANEPMTVASSSKDETAAPATRPAPEAPESLPPSLRPQETKPAAIAESLTTSDALATRLASQLRTDPRNPAVHLEHQLLQMLLGRPVPQLESIASLSADDREVLAALMDALSNFRTTLRSEDNALIGNKTRPLLDLADRLRASSALRLPNVAFCTDVRRFGVYEELESRRFIPGKKHEVIVYCDVENFESRAAANGQWETSLIQELAIYSEAGQRLDQSTRQPVKDLSRSRRRDFFIAAKTALPATLAPGHYYMKVTVIDTLSQRQTQQTLPFQIADR